MNEVKVSPMVPSAVSGTASSATQGNQRKNNAEEVGNSLPPEPKVVEKQEPELAAPEETVAEAVAELNQYMQSEQRNLLFSVDDDSGDIVVRVVDRASGDLIRQIPSQMALDLAERARQNEPLQLVNMQG